MLAAKQLKANNVHKLLTVHLQTLAVVTLKTTKHRNKKLCNQSSKKEVCIRTQLRKSTIKVHHIQFNNNIAQNAQASVVLHAKLAVL